MWPRRKKGEDLTARAQTAAALLIATANEFAPAALKALFPADEIAREKQALTAPLAFELLLFALHVTDRLAFEQLGADQKEKLMLAVLRAVRSKLHPLASNGFIESYNTRQRLYGACRKLYPDEGENLAGTLFWEFGRATGDAYAENNPESVSQAAIFGMKFVGIVERMLDGAQVLR